MMCINCLLKAFALFVSDGYFSSKVNISVCWIELMLLGSQQKCLLMLNQAVSNPSHRQNWM